MKYLRFDSLSLAAAVSTTTAGLFLLTSMQATVTSERRFTLTAEQAEVLGHQSIVSLDESLSPAMARVPDISSIEIRVVVSRTNGILHSYPYCFSLELAGANIDTATVRTPAGVLLSLTQINGETWGTGINVTDLCEIANDPVFGFGNHEFTVVGPAGSDSATVAFDPQSPTCTTDFHTGYGNITFPLDGQTGVDLFPTLAWQCANGACGNHAWSVLVDPSGAPGEQVATLTPSAISWTPAECLQGSLPHQFILVAQSVLPPGIQTLMTTMQDSFEYRPSFDTRNQVTFTTQAALGTSFCATSPNSAGAGATLCASGSAVAATQDLTLVASGCPDNAPGQFYFGPSQLPGAPFGDGLRCVAVPGSMRMYPFATSGPANGQPAGTAAFTLDFVAPYAASLSPGTSLNFQYWYRDSAAMLSGFNLTDAYNIVFQ